MKHYISIEKNIKIFELYKALWNQHGVTGIRADNMTEGIEKAIEIEKSKADELYFIVIVADDVDFMAQLKILSAETNAPILIATSNPVNEEHHQSLRNGADFYGEYCETTEQNIGGVISIVDSIDRRVRKQKISSETIIYKNLLVSPVHRCVFVDNAEIELTRTEFDVLYYLMSNRGRVLSFMQIYRHVWKDRNEEVATTAVRNTIQRIRNKTNKKDTSDSFIENIWGVGFRLP